MNAELEIKKAAHAAAEERLALANLRLGGARRALDAAQTNLDEARTAVDQATTRLNQLLESEARAEAALHRTALELQEAQGG